MIIDDIMNKVIATPRKHVSEYAPKIEKVQIQEQVVRILIRLQKKQVLKQTYKKQDLFQYMVKNKKIWIKLQK